MEAQNVILAGTDFSPHARHAVLRGALLARESGDRLRMLHVLSAPLLSSLKSLLGMPVDIEGRLQQRAVAELERLAAEIERMTGVTAEAGVTTGDTVEELVEAALETQLLILGAHGESGLRDFFLGSVAERSLRRSRRPVLVVKRPPTEPYRRVLVPVAFGPHSRAALRAAMDIAPTAEVTVFHSFALPFESTLQLAGIDDEQVEVYRTEARAEALSKIRDLIAALGPEGGRIGRAVEHGDAAPTILAKQAEMGSDLLVMGRRGEIPLQGVLLGSVTRHILFSSSADVLVVGADMGDPESEGLASAAADTGS